MCTGDLAAHFLPVTDFFAGAHATAENVLNIRVGFAVVLVASLGLLFWGVRQALRDLGKVHGMPASLAIGGLIGGVLGAGQVSVLRLALEMQHV